MLLTLERLTGSKKVAEDIVADCFIKVLNNPAPFESFQKLKAFLFITASNAGRDWLRAEKRHHAAHAQIRYTADDAEDAIEMELVRSEVLIALYDEIEKLPSQYREIMKRTFIEGEL